jgi:anion-transporting  ArsA/GET3 family ATPase
MMCSRARPLGRSHHQSSRLPGFSITRAFDHVIIDTAPTGHTLRLLELPAACDLLNPAELLLAALSARMIKGIERVVPMLKFSLRGVEILVHGVRQDVPPRMERSDYEIVADTDEPHRRLELMHDNVKKYGTMFNTVVPART